LGGAAGAVDNWGQDKDSIICEFARSLGGTAVDVENQFEAAMFAVYGNLVDDGLMADIIGVVEASGVADWIAERVFDNGDFQPLDYPDGYECCQNQPADGLWYIALGDSGYCEADVAIVEPNTSYNPHVVGGVTKVSKYGSYVLEINWDLEQGSFVGGDYAISTPSGMALKVNYETEGTDSGSFDIGEEAVIVNIPSSGLTLLQMRWQLENYTHDCPREVDFVVVWEAQGAV